MLDLVNLPIDDPCEINDNGIIYPSVLHYVLSCKTDDIEMKKRIASSNNPVALARRIKEPKNWEEIKRIAMESGLRFKFREGSEYRYKLLYSRGAVVYLNNVHDNFWGKCECKMCENVKAKNIAGKMMLGIRTDMLYDLLLKHQ